MTEYIQIFTGKYGDGSDVTTWKINFRCALNGLKDIVERKDLEGPDCRIYQMLPSTSPGRQLYNSYYQAIFILVLFFVFFCYCGIGRRRKRRRPIIHYSEMMQLQTTPTDVSSRDVRPKLDLAPGIPALTPCETPSTPLSTGKGRD